MQNPPAFPPLELDPAVQRGGVVSGAYYLMLYMARDAVPETPSIDSARLRTVPMGACMCGIRRLAR